MKNGAVKNKILIGYFTHATWNDLFGKNVEKITKLMLYSKIYIFTPVLATSKRLGFKNGLGRANFDIMGWKGKNLRCE